MKQCELDKVLKLHNMWLNEEAGGVKADLREANLCDANLSGANLRDANLCDANLRYADLSGANLCWADLREANLCDANLSGANLRWADLREADLRGANLSGADLRGADLSDANLRGVHLYKANGFDIMFNNTVLTEFFVGISKAWGIITIGCRTHTVAEWKEYINSDQKYIEDCRDEASHQQCIKVIQRGIKYIETGIFE